MLSLSRIQAGLGAIALVAAIGMLSPGLASADGGVATWYGPGFQGNAMNNGQIFNMYDPTTTACNIYPLGTWVEVTNPTNGKSVTVQVRDRGGFTHALDLSYAAFKSIADPALMGIHVNYEVVSGPAGKPISSRATPSTRGNRPAPSGQYVVQAGDTLNGIADQTSVDAGKLVAWNNLSNPDSVVVGQVLRLTAPAAPAAAPAPSSHGYVVQSGDTLLGIAQQLGVSADQLAAANSLSDPNSIVVGQTLAVPGGSDKSKTPKTYTIQPGDTVSGIAQNFGISVDSLTAANQIDDPSLIQPGAKLTIPGQ